MITNNSILRTLDGGLSWKRSFSFENPRSNVTIAIAPVTPNVIYASSTRVGRSIMKSEDGGDTWLVWPDSLLPIGDVRLVVDPLRSQVVYASSAGVFKSSDSGMSWVPKNEGLIPHPVNGLIFVNALAFNPLNANSLYAATDKGLFKSVDNGEHWIQLGTDTTGIDAVAVMRTDTSTIYATTPSHLSALGRLRRSKDEGSNWEKVNSPWMKEILSFAIDPDNAATIWITAIDEFTHASQVFRSVDEGLNWKLFSSGLPYFGVGEIFIPLSKRQTLFALTDLGLYRLENSSIVQERQDQLPDKVQLFQTYPNPSVMGNRISATNQRGSFSRIIIEYYLPSECRVELTIYNVLGQLVAALVSHEQPVGRHRVNWNGRDLNGHFVRPGVYFMKLATPGTTHTKKMLLVE